MNSQHSVDEDNDEMKELLGIHYVSIGHFFFGIVTGSE